MDEITTTQGTVYWVTGLAGAGKTTIAQELFSQLRAKKTNVVLLDGDLLREVYGNDLGHSPEDRRQVAGRNSRMCKMLAAQGLDVVCATISMFHSTHQWNREHIPNYFEIYLEVPMDVLVERDQKKLYTRALQGEEQNVMGVDVQPELPKQPHVTILNDGSRTPEAIVETCVSFFETY